MHRSIAIPLIAMILWGSAAFPFSGMGRSKWDGVPASGAVDISVRFPDGTGAGGAAVVAGRKVVMADGSGSVKLPAGIPATTGVVAAEITRGEGGFLGLFRKDIRYIAIQQVEPQAGAPLSVQLKLAPAGDIDASCRSCHPEKATSVAPIVRCVHKAGVVVKPAQVAKVKAFNRENEALRKAGKPAMPPIRLLERSDNKGFFKSKVSVLACMTCHTNHVDTGIRKYVLMPFDDPSTLCRGCHV